MSVFSGLSLPKVLFEGTSQYNNKIAVIQYGEVTKLLTNGVMQSVNWDAKSVERKFWGKVLTVLKENEPALTNILIFGMGGGTMHHIISHAFPGVYITSVEIDPVIVDLAKKYFGVDTIPHHTIINEDACRVVIEPERYGLARGSFQALLVDIFVGEEYPDLGKSGNFITSLKDLVGPGGLVVFNRIYYEHMQDEVNNFIELVEQHFRDVKSLIIAGTTNSDNVLIYGRV